MSCTVHSLLFPNTKSCIGTACRKDTHEAMSSPSCPHCWCILYPQTNNWITPHSLLLLVHTAGLQSPFLSSKYQTHTTTAGCLGNPPASPSWRIWLLPWRRNSRRPACSIACNTCNSRKFCWAPHSPPLPFCVWIPCFQLGMNTLCTPLMPLVVHRCVSAAPTGEWWGEALFWIRFWCWHQR